MYTVDLRLKNLYKDPNLIISFDYDYDLNSSLFFDFFYCACNMFSPEFDFEFYGDSHEVFEFYIPLRDINLFGLKSFLNLLSCDNCMIRYKSETYKTAISLLCGDIADFLFDLPF